MKHAKTLFIVALLGQSILMTLSAASASTHHFPEKPMVAASDDGEQKSVVTITEGPQIGRAHV